MAKKRLGVKCGGGWNSSFERGGRHDVFWGLLESEDGSFPGR